MEIGNIGYNHWHESVFKVYKPKRESSWLFMLLKSPARFVINGKEIFSEENSFILYKYGTPQEYGSNDEIFRNDWIYLVVNEEDESLLRALEIPLDTVVKLKNADELDDMIVRMTYEFSSGSMYSTDIGDLYLKLMFFKISEQMKNLKLKGNTDVKLSRLRNLRRYIYEYPNVHRSIDSLSAEYAMSRSSFQHSYKKLFGVSFMQDVSAARTERAKEYLKSSSMTVVQIAERCGYNSDLHFIRQFKKVCGMTPTEYRTSCCSQ